jgi:hypothetical protein
MVFRAYHDRKRQSVAQDENTVPICYSFFVILVLFLLKSIIRVGGYISLEEVGHPGALVPPSLDESKATTNEHKRTVLSSVLDPTSSREPLFFYDRSAPALQALRALYATLQDDGGSARGFVTLSD